jgi:putative phosphonate metabolism protein
MTLSSRARVAVFYAPEPDDVLFTRGAAWLGRDPETGAPVPQPDVPGIEEITAAPRLYGLHATLKPPMRLRPGVTWEQVLAEAEALMHGMAPFPLPPLAVADLDGFLALRETEPSTELQAFADLCVAGLDHLRAPSSEEELARRRRAGLSASEEAMLARFGYPYVFGNWRFHITLTRQLAPGERQRIAEAARCYFACASQASRMVRSLCLFCQPEPDAPFLLAERIPLRG